MLRVAHSAYFQGGGIGMYTVEVLRELGRSADIDPYLICSPDFEWQRIPGVTTVPVLQSLHHPLPALRKARFLKAQWSNPARLLAQVGKLKLDILHLQSFHHLSFAQWAKPAARLPVKWVISAHDIKRDVAIINKGWEDRQLQASYRFADAVLVHSEFQRQELIQFARVKADKVHLVPHGPYFYESTGETKEELRVSLGIPASAEVALCFGQIRKDKNLETFLTALASSRTDTHLIVAGQPGGHHDGAEDYRSLSSKLGIQDRVHFFFGHVRDEDVAKYFEAANWIALPYRTSFTSQSGVLNIAAQFELPVLVSNAPVLSETVMVTGIGYACDGDDVKELIHGIEKMQFFKDSIPSSAFLNYRDEYSWAKNAKTCASIYKELVQ